MTSGAVGVEGALTLEMGIRPPPVATVYCLNAQWQKPHCLPGDAHILMHTQRLSVADISLILRQFKCMG